MNWRGKKKEKKIMESPRFEPGLIFFRLIIKCCPSWPPRAQRCLRLHCAVRGQEQRRRAAPQLQGRHDEPLAAFADNSDGPYRHCCFCHQGDHHRHLQEPVQDPRLLNNSLHSLLTGHVCLLVFIVIFHRVAGNI